MPAVGDSPSKPKALPLPAAVLNTALAVTVDEDEAEDEAESGAEGRGALTPSACSKAVDAQALDAWVAVSGMTGTTAGETRPKASLRDPKTCDGCPSEPSPSASLSNGEGLPVEGPEGAWLSLPVRGRLKPLSCAPVVDAKARLPVSPPPPRSGEVAAPPPVWTLRTGRARTRLERRGISASARDTAARHAWRELAPVPLEDGAVAPPLRLGWAGCPADEAGTAAIGTTAAYPVPGTGMPGW